MPAFSPWSPPSVTSCARRGGRAAPASLPPGRRVVPRYTSLVRVVPTTHDLVLVGGGHTHIQVLKSWAMSPEPGVRLTLIVDQPVANYSGIVTGLLAGQDRRGVHEMER